MNGRANCILAVCCEQGSAQQRAALVDEILEALEADQEAALSTGGATNRAARRRLAREELDLLADAMATWILGNFDLAPKGSLDAFKREIARLARQGHRRIAEGDHDSAAEGLV
jgi:hypothetical protein